MLYQFVPTLLVADLAGLFDADTGKVYRCPADVAASATAGQSTTSTGYQKIPEHRVSLEPNERNFLSPSTVICVFSACLSLVIAGLVFIRMQGEFSVKARQRQRTEPGSRR